MDNWFWVRVMATEGDLTVSRKTLDQIAKDTALKGNLIKQCQAHNINYDSLLPEEKDYLIKEVKNKCLYL